MRILVTGGAGFIGSHFVRLLLTATDHDVVNFDKLTYAGNLENLSDVEGHPRYSFVKGDITDASQLEVAHQRFAFDAIVNFAAESHVDRSIISAGDFLATNIVGTQNVIDLVRSRSIRRFLHVSTDEVYGSIAEGGATEESPLKPGNPYSASKASADLLCLAAHRTFGLPVLITRSTNNYGPNQFPEKFIPLAVTNLMEGKKIPIYGTGINVRNWIWVEDNCRAILDVLERGKVGEIYNVGGGDEAANVDIARSLVQLLGKDESALEFVTDRPGHDLRYSLDCTKITREIGFSPKTTLTEGLARTVEWYKRNETWWRRVKSGEYLAYYETNYAGRQRLQ
jgi:dTDP-glucose 4,6-dehydratase